MNAMENLSKQERWAKFYKENNVDIEKHKKTHSLNIEEVCVLCSNTFIKNVWNAKKCHTCYLKKFERKTNTTIAPKGSRPKRGEVGYREYKNSKETRWRRTPAGIAYVKRRNLRRQNATGTVSKKDWVDLIKKYGNMCLACKKSFNEVKPTVDHIIPISVGGKHTIDNLQPLCMKCNCNKFTKTIDYRNQYML